MRVVWVTGRGQADCRFGLECDELREVVYLIEGPRSVGDLPDNNRCDLDRVPFRVVDLRQRGLLVTDPGRYLYPLAERIDPVQSRGSNRAKVAPEELDDYCLTASNCSESPGPGDAEGEQRGPLRTRVRVMALLPE
jgi:hypothetical protein